MAKEKGRLRCLWDSDRRAWRWNLADSLENWRDAGEDYYDDLRDKISYYWFDKQFDIVFGTLYYYFRYSWRRRLEDVTSKYTVKTGIACVVVTASVVTLLYIGKRTGYLDKFHIWWRRLLKKTRTEEEFALCKYAASHSSSLHPAQRHLLTTLEAGHLAPSTVMQANQIHLLQLLLANRTATSGFIIGINSGYGILSLALSLLEGGELVVCDESEVSGDVLTEIKPYLKEGDVDQKVEFIIKPVSETLDELANGGRIGTFGFGLLEGTCKNHTVYYEKCLRLLRPGGLLLFFNVLNDGDVLNTSVEELEETSACKLFNEELFMDKRITVTLLPFGTGIAVVTKKDDNVII